jgi:hypothetical protein
MQIPGAGRGCARSCDRARIDIVELGQAEPGREVLKEAAVLGGSVRSVTAVGVTVRE